MRIWFKIWKDTKLIKDHTVIRNENDTRTHKVFAALEEACHELNLGTPVWLEKNIKDFKRLSRCRFYQDNFMESIDFDYLEMLVIDED
jgi:hypothetical protein